MKLKGRIKILTDQKEINDDNIIEVLTKAYSKHRINASEMQILIDYELGIQPLPYEKIVRPEINIQTSDNMANYVTEFKKGFFWGNPPIYTQRANDEHHNTDSHADSAGISALNEMMLNGVGIGKKNQQLADFVEKTGIGHRLVDAKTEWDDEKIQSSYAEIETLDSRFAFCVYYAGVGQKKVLGVTYTKSANRNIFTCFTDKYQYEISAGKIVSKKPNVLGRIPIVEYDRSVDRTGCFERQMDLMDNLNSLVSSVANDAVQRTQEIWWGNDVDFEEDPATGEAKTPKSGQWVITYSGDGKNPKIQPMSSTLDTSPVLQNITETRNEILKRCFVPMQYSSEGGGSTGVATDTMSGWNATAVDAAREEQLVQDAAREELILILRAINLVPESKLPAKDPLRKLHHTDINIHFVRQKNYDLNSKINASATAIGIGVHPRWALQMGGGVWPDVEQVWLDSRETMEAYQNSLVNKQDESEATPEQQDESDQISQSPAVDGMSTDRAQQME